MAKIEHITKISWTQPDGKAGYCYHVFYEKTGFRPGRKFTYSFKDNLPKTVVYFLLEAEHCETTYTEKANGQRGKIERFTR